MAFTGVDVYAVRQYTSPNDPDKENPTVFDLGALDARIMAHLKDSHMSTEVTDSGPKMNIGSAAFSYDVVRFGLKGMRNFLHPQTGKEVKFDVKSISIRGRNYEGVSDQVMDLLPAALIAELASEIMTQNKLGEEEQKN
jgi:hypothetical protein